MTFTGVFLEHPEQIDSVGQRIREARTHAGLSQTELARRVGVSGRRTVLRWEKNIHVPEPDLRITLEETLGLPPGHLDPPPQDALVERLESVLAEAQWILNELKRGGSEARPEDL